MANSCTSTYTYIDDTAGTGTYYLNGTVITVSTSTHFDNVVSTSTDFAGTVSTSTSTHPDGAHAIRITAVVVHNGDVIVANVSFLVVAVWILVSGRHQRGHVKYHCQTQKLRET